MNKKIKILKGMHDILPQNTDAWINLEKILYNWTNSYGYKQIRTPILENTDLFKRSIGNQTDVINKEMYVFNDLDNTSISLRPEGTASCLRSIIENNLLYGNNIQKLWYIGPMFRRERPQKGRFRQFHQIGIEALGCDSFDIDVEIIEMINNLFNKLLIIDKVELQINSLGNKEERNIFKNELISYFKKYEDELDIDNKRKLYTNPLRILDSKNPDIQYLCNNAPILINYLSDESLENYNKIKKFLSKLNINFKENYRLVRGLDYYNHIVFEWITNDLGSQSAICAGGRYDGLINDLGGGNYTGVGFAIGIERLLLILEYYNNKEIFENTNPDIYIISKDTNEKFKSMEYAIKLRKIGYNVYYHCGLQKIPTQFKKADLSKAKLAIIIGEEELLNNTVTIKNLRGSAEQLTVSKNEYINLINNWMKK